jgi:hypothetical protein
MTADGPNLPGRSPSKGAMLFIALVAGFSLAIASYTVRKEVRYSDQGVHATAQVTQKERHYSGGRRKELVSVHVSACLHG